MDIDRKKQLQVYINLNYSVDSKRLFTANTD